MSSVQDHPPVVHELSERQGPQPNQPEQPQSQALPRTRDTPSSPREITSEAPGEYSPPRFSQLLDTLPEGSGPQPPRRGISNGTNSATLVNHPGTVGGPNNDDGMQNSSVTQERSQNQLTPTSDRRPQIIYDPIRGDNTPVRIQLSDDGDHGRGSVPRVSVPLPRPVFNTAQNGSGNGSGNGSRVALRGASGGELYLHPQQPQEPPQKTVKERIQPTLDAAILERNKCKKQARIQGIMLNGAIGLQVIVGAVTTGVAAGSKNIGSAVAVLGGISTALASYLAKARGSGEPESSRFRSKELSTFIREVEAFILDKGHKVGTEFDPQIATYRERFELIIKTEGENSTSGTGYASHSRGYHPPNFHPVPSQQQMATMHGGGQYMSQGNGGMNGPLNEKQQMWRNEKALSAMV